MAKDKVNEKEALRKENLEETVSKTDQFYNEHKKTIWTVICAVVVVALCVFAYVKLVYQPKCAEAAQRAFPAEQCFAEENYELALNGDESVFGLADVIAEYGSKAGAAVYMEAGVCALQLGNYEEALDYLKKYKGKEPILAASALGCQGDCYVGLEKYSEAAAAYSKAAAKADNVYAAKYLLKAGIVYEELGEMLFTHFGVSGPLVLSASSYLADAPEGARLEIDLKPGLNEDQLDARLLRDFEKYRHKQVRNAMVELLPSRLIETVLTLAAVDPTKTIDELTREERRAIANTLKCLKLTVKRARPIEEAIITRGGVSIKEIDPRTMGSKLVDGLYFAGEVIDADACTGGFNLQIAWSTGAAAGEAAACESGY